MHPLIVNLSDQRPTWLLVYTDWLFTQQARPFLSRIRDVIVVGRVRWIEGTKDVGYDNCCWLLFDCPRPDGSAVFQPSARELARRFQITTSQVGHRPYKRNIS
jgi:hypothetical protein